MVQYLKMGIQKLTNTKKIKQVRINLLTFSVGLPFEVEVFARKNFCLREMFIFINFVQKSNCSFLVMALGNLGNLKCISGKSFGAQKLLPEMVHGTIYRGRLQLKNQSVTIPNTSYPKCHFTQCVKFKQLRVGSGFCLIITDFGEGDNKGSLQNPIN